MHKARLTISRPSYSDDRKKISIQVKDVDAGIRFLTIEVDLDKFSECITGLSETECEMEVFGLTNVGKMIERDRIEFEIEDRFYREADEYLYNEAIKHVPEGWICSRYFGSKDSTFIKDGKRYARASIMRWVKK